MRKIFDFHGGIHPAENKLQSVQRPILSAGIPELLILPLSQHIGAPAAPVVSVGNLHWGGTGKTPLVVRLCELLTARGHLPAVISRGYGRDTRGALRVDRHTPARTGGDEPLLELDVDVEVAVQEPRAGAAGAVLGDGFLGGFLDLGMVGQPQVVVGARKYGAPTADHRFGGGKDLLHLHVGGVEARLAQVPSGGRDILEFA